MAEYTVKEKMEHAIAEAAASFMTNEYVVKGAQLKCTLGSAPSLLNLPLCHGFYATGHPIIHSMDNKPMVNIMPFGTCPVLGGPCVPAPVGPWLNTHDKTMIADAAPGGPLYPAVTMKSFLVCALGGLIEPKKSGQEYKAPGASTTVEGNGNMDSSDYEKMPAYTGSNGFIGPIPYDSDKPAEYIIDTSGLLLKSKNIEDIQQETDDVESKLGQENSYEEEIEPGLIQTRWPYVFRYEDGRIDARYHSNSLQGITGYSYTIRHPGYDIIVPFTNDLTRPGMASDKICICCPFDGVVLAGAFNIRDDENYHKQLKDEVNKNYGGNWMKYGDTQNWSQGNYVAVQTKNPIKYIKFTRDGTWNKIKREQGEDILVVRFLHMQMDRGGHPALPTVGEEIKAGTFIGYVGNTGRSNPAHLHIDVNFQGTPNRVLSIPYQTIDPRQFFIEFQEEEIFAYNG